MNTTFVLPRYNVKAPDTGYFNVFNYPSSQRQYGSLSNYVDCSDMYNIHIYGNIRVKNAAQMKGVTIATVGLNNSGTEPSTGVAYNCGFDINFFDDSGNPLEVEAFEAVSKIDQSYSSSTLATVYNTFCKTNIVADYAVFTNAYSSNCMNLSDMLYASNYVAKNCYFNLTNQKDLTGIDLSTYEGYTPGFMALQGVFWSNAGTLGANPAASGPEPSYEKLAVLAPFAVKNNFIGMASMYLPEGNSAVFAKYSSNPSTMDAYNVGTAETLPDMADYMHLTWPAGISKIESWEPQEEGYYTTFDEQIFHEVAVEDEINGKLAYLLDRGDNVQRRGREWTVTETIMNVTYGHTNQSCHIRQYAPLSRRGLLYI